MASPVKHQIGAWTTEPGPNAQTNIRDDLPIPSPSSGEVLIKLECTGVCHSDVHSIFGHTPMTTNIAGHEGIGYVIKAGPNTSPDLLNTRVGVKWLYSYCNDCEICSEDVTYCPRQCNTGRNVPGTFQQYIVSPAETLTIIPKALDSFAAAPLLCAGVTMYSAIAKLNLEAGQWLVLPGAGGGLGHLGVQIAHRLGLKVIAIDTGEGKRKLCMGLGATAFFDFKTDDIPNMVNKLTNGQGAHAAICLASSRAGYAQSLALLRNLGQLVCIGLSKEDLPITPFGLIVRGIKVTGSSVGTKEELDELMEMASNGEIKPLINVYEFDRLVEVLNMLKNNQVEGRVVVKIPQ